MELIKSFYEKQSDNPIYDEAFKCSIFQQYLTNPGKYTTYLRVLMSASGDVMGASLKYRSKTIAKPSLSGLFDKIFLNPDSEYFLETTKMFNYYSGGGNISFYQPRYSDEKIQVLTEQGFDVQNLKLPSGVLDVCKNIMKNCNREVGILCGIDFMLNENDGLWYYLENQAFPAIDEWAQVKGITIPSSNNINGYLRTLDLDL